MNKTKYFLTTMMAIVVALLSGCNDDQSATLLDGVKVSSSYIAIPIEGGSQTITLNAKGDWKIEKVVVTKTKKNTDGTVTTEVVDDLSWINISQTSGTAGEAKVTFSCDQVLDARTADLKLICGNEVQLLKLMQGVPTVKEASVAEVQTGTDGKTFQVTGVCTSIENTVYGNWYLTDATGSLYIYGTLDKNASPKNFASLGIEVGDEVTVKGPKKTYNGTIELVDVTVIKINKSLVKVDSLKNSPIDMQGGEALAYVTCKGNGLNVEIPEDAREWLGMQYVKQSGTSNVIAFRATPNTGGDRSATVTFRTTDGKKEYTAKTTISQKGAIVNVSVADFIAAPVSTSQYRLTGVVSKADGKGSFTLSDYSGSVYIYSLADFKEKNIKNGDIVTIVGQRAEYKGTAQMGKGGATEKLIPVTQATIADILTKADDKNTYFMVTGVISRFDEKDFAKGEKSYGNLYIKEAGSDKELYVYGVYPGYGATGDARLGVVTKKNLKVGDKLTIIGTKGSYKDVPQLMYSIYYSHESAQ